MADQGAAPAARRGRLGRLLHRLTQETHEIAAAELTGTSSRLGSTTTIAAAVPRQPAVVVGEVSSVALRPAAQVAALLVEIFDGTGSMQLIWLGRRAIAGIEPGTLLRVHGRVTLRGTQRVIFNPAYEIVTDRG